MTKVPHSHAGASYATLAQLVKFRPLTSPIKSAGKPSPFSAKWSSTVEVLARELRAIGARDVVLEIDLREHDDFRLDGLPRADRRTASPGIRLSFKATSVFGEPRLMYEVGTYSTWQENLRAVALGLEHLRAADRYGITKRGQQYAGWRQIDTASARTEAERGRDLIREHGGLSEALKATHPDAGGNADDFRAVLAARDAS